MSSTKFAVNQSKVTPSELGSVDTTKRNALDDIVLIFLNSMMDLIVESWVTVTTNDTNLVKLDEMDKDFYDYNTSFSYRKSKFAEYEFGTSLKYGDMDDDTVSDLKSESLEENLIAKDWRLYLPDEIAIVKLKNGNIYKGSISSLMMNGFGRYRWSNGQYYEGTFLKNTVTGRGKMRWPDTNWYKGEFFDNFRNGLGTFCLESTTILYHGYWFGGRKNGRGCLFYNSQEFYDGEWSNNFYDGVGQYKYDNGCYYYGEFKQGKRHGIGVMYWSNNDIYKGDWENGVRQGYGEYTWNALMTQDFVYPIENIYKGMWENGCRNGFGKLIFGYIHGGRYEGYFKNNLKHGHGAIVCGNGTVIRRDPLFLDDKPIHVHDDLKFYTEPIDKNQMCLYIPSHLKCINSDIIDSRKLITISQKHEESLLNTRDDQLLSYNFKKQIEYYQKDIIDIPLHKSSHLIDCSYYIKKIYNSKLNKKLFSDPQKGQSSFFNFNKSSRSSRVSQTTTKVTLSNIYEEKCTQDCLFANLSRLWNLYINYSNVCMNKSQNNQTVMIRLFLWQLYRDCKLITKISLAKIDELLVKNRAVYIEDVHNPFEQIYFCQFLHSLLSIAWELYFDDESEGFQVRGLLAGALSKLLYTDIYPNAFNHKGNVLLVYNDLVPIDAMYNFYCSLGQTISVRQFINWSVSKNGKDSKAWQETFDYSTHKSFYNGKHVVFPGGYVEYIPDKSAIILTIKSNDCFEECQDLDEYYDCLSILQKIGICEIVQCLSKVCPLIQECHLLINMDYEMVFLEFYESIVGCILRYLEIIDEKNKDAKILDETKSKNLENQLNNRGIRIHEKTSNDRLLSHTHEPTVITLVTAKTREKSSDSCISVDSII